MSGDVVIVSPLLSIFISPLSSMFIKRVIKNISYRTKRDTIFIETENNATDKYSTQGNVAIH